MATQNPFENGMERRLLLSMALSMAVLFLVPYIYNTLYPPPPAPLSEQSQPSLKSQSFSETTLVPTSKRSPMSATNAVPQVVELENEDLILRWNTVSAFLESSRLKRYRTATDGPLELVRSSSSTLPRAFSVRVGDTQLDQRLSEAVYEARGPFREAASGALNLGLYYRDELIEVSRQIHVPAAGHVIEISTEVLINGRSVPFKMFLGAGIGTTEGASSQDFANPMIAYHKEGSVTRLGESDLGDSPVQLQGPVRWVALDSQFFTCLVLDVKEMLGSEMTSISSVVDVSGTHAIEPPLLSVELELSPGANLSAFLGPKDYNVLKEVDVALPMLIDYGWFAFLVKPLLVSLKFVYEYVNNYGWAIIILTFGINLALFPVRYKQMSSMKKMSEVQPQMKTIQAKYKQMKKDDPRRTKMNKEVMELYKRHGVNPLGGCLPLVIQMPFLFAFYSMLYSSIELRGAPFIGWIQDLSQQDPYYITPVVMGVTMVAQQKISPAAGDPAQRKMMMLLPVVFTFFFLSLSSGLVLYFLFSNVFGMMLQFLMQRWDPALASKPVKKRTKSLGK